MQDPRSIQCADTQDLAKTSKQIGSSPAMYRSSFDTLCADTQVLANFFPGVHLPCTNLD